MICGGGAWPGRGSTFRPRTQRVLGQLRAEGLRARGPCAYEVRCRLSAVCSAAQTVRDGGRPLPVAGQRAGLPPGRLNTAGSAVPLVPRSAEAVLGMQRRVAPQRRLVPLSQYVFSRSVFLLNVLLDGDPAVYVHTRAEDVNDAAILLQNQADQSHGFARF